MEYSEDHMGNFFLLQPIVKNLSLHLTKKTPSLNISIFPSLRLYGNITKLEVS